MKWKWLIGITLSFLLVGAGLGHFFKDSILTGILTLGLEEGYTQELLNKTIDPLTFKYEQEDEALVEELITFIEPANTLVYEWFPTIQIEAPLNVFLIQPMHEFYQNFLYDNRLGVYFENHIVLDTREYNPESTFVHEYAHYLIAQLLKQKNIEDELIPSWFHEGFATSFEWHIMDGLPETVGYYDIVPFKQLQLATDSNTINLYAQGFYAIMDLINRVGMEGITTILEKTGESQDFEMAFTSVTGLSLQNYHENFDFDKDLTDHFYTLSIDNPEALIDEAEALLANRAEINPYSIDLAQLLLNAHAQFGHEEKVRNYAKLSSSLLLNPIYLLATAEAVVAFDKQLAEEIVEKAIKHAVTWEFDQQHIEEQGKEILNNSQ